MRVAFCCSEVFPFAKTGGLGDVGAALPKALAEAGCEVKVFMPLYKGIKPDKRRDDFCLSREHGVEIIFLKHDDYFGRDSLYVDERGKEYPDNAERFAFLSKSILEVLEKIDFSPDIIHTNDWHTSLVSVYLKSLYTDSDFFKNTKCFLTIHNLLFQGIFARDKFSCLGLPLKYSADDFLGFDEQINYLKGGIIFSDMVTTVSPTYAGQIRTADYGCGLDEILLKKGDNFKGILNAIDYSIWNPETDPLIFEKYSKHTLSGKRENKLRLQRALGLRVDGETFLLGLVARLDEQKGIDILIESLDDILQDCQLIILGVGDSNYQAFLDKKAKDFKDCFSLNIKFDEKLAHNIYAASDAFLVPSKFEPCGLTQMIAYRYASLPIVHHAGGLKDTVTDIEEGGGGFVFNDYTSQGLTGAILRARNLFKEQERWMSISDKIMQYDFSWERAAEKYIEAYKETLVSEKLS